MKRTKTSLLKSALALLLCVSMLIGSTFAWFTDSVTSKGNIIQSGNLDIEMYWTDDLNSGNWYNVEDDAHNTIFSYDKWEPGYTDVKYIKLVNKGNLAMNYKLTLTPQGSVGKLAEVINVFFADKAVDVQSREDLSKLGAIGLLNNVLNGGATANGTLLAKDQYSPLHPSGEVIMTIAMNMITTAGNEYQEKDSGEFTITALATQASFEKDSFGSDYDSNAEYPTIITGGTVTTQVNAVDGKVPAGGVTMTGNGISAFVPGGIEMAAGADALTLSVTPMEHTTTDITVVNNEILIPVDVHISGIAAGNTTPIVIDLGEVLPKYMNMGNYHLYHVENGANSTMTLVGNEADLTEHNRFTYDPLTGAVKVAMASFSEVALVADTTNPWGGNIDVTWYDEAKNTFEIANADQFVGLSALVGGMTAYANGQNIEKASENPISFAGKTINLLSDLDLNGGKATVNNEEIQLFYPVGYYNDEGSYAKTGTAITSGFKNFEGTFDGNGHTISNIYHNTWEMKGDHDWYAPTDQHYRDGMGLFGKVYGGTIKNLTVDNFKSDGEITTTGVIAAYADGATFENIAITNCNPRVYNIGNGGIVGCVGWYAKDANLKTTFKNITVDNSNKISALWGSYDVACGGIVGQYYPTSGQTSAGTPANGGISFENCHVAAQMDVYNDVCGNYQYYAYRYAGMLIGSIRENETINGYVYPKMDGITAEGCTVHFGTWNDYYYCEFEKNGHPSYSGPNDYKFSRVPNEEIDTSKGKENATCIGHNHTEVEDNQAVYLPFNNLVTGYGWGVTTKVVGELEGVTILDREEGKSVVKFQSTIKELANNKTYKFSDIFKFVNNGVNLVPDALTVAIANKDDTNPVSATIVYDRNNWENGTITLTGTGDVEITIQDYYFCTPTTIEVTVADRQPAEKFTVVMNNGDFLHRVGNKGTVALDKLFKAKDGAGTPSVTIEAVNGSSASGTYSNNAIQFSGTGVVKVTITDNDYCTPTELYLEVVDAVNATSATSATKNNVVLLNDCGFGSLEVSGGYTLYGNGFAMTCSNDSVAIDRTYSFVELKGGTLDNVKIIAPNFSHAIMYEKNKTESEWKETDSNGRTRYYNIRSAVLVSANSQITNSYISGGRAAVYATAGTLTVKNSTIYGGAVANIQAEASSNLVLEDVTLIQKPIKANVNDTSKTLMGFSVVMMCDTSGVGAPVTLKGYLHQYAWANKDYAEYVPSDAQDVVTEVLGKSEFVHSITYADGKTRDSVNLGFAYMPVDTNATNADNMNDVRPTNEKNKFPYESTSVQVIAKIYTYKNTAGTDASVRNEPGYNATTQGTVIPEVSYTDANNARVFTTSYDTAKGQWKSTLKVDVDAGEYVFSFANLLVQKYGNNLSYTVKTEDGTVVDKNTVITLNSAVSNTYILTITDNQIYDKNGNNTGTTVETTYIFELVSTKTSLPAPEWTDKNLTGTPYIVVDTKDSDWNCAIPVLDGLKVKYWSKKQNQEVELDLASVVTAANLSKGLQNSSNNTITITVADEYTLTITTTGFKTNDNGKPVVVNGKLYFTVSSSSNYVSTKTTDRTISITYSFTDANNSEPVNLSTSFSVVYTTYKSKQYKYSDFCNGTLTEATCLTPDTLITLADGTQVRVDSLKGDELLLVWNLETGKYEAAPIVFVDSEQEKAYEIIHLYFSDGSDVKVISEHGFFDLDLGKYVYIDANNYADYVGHRFVAEGDIAANDWNIVTLDKVVIETEVTTAWSPVTFEHLCYYTNGVLSMPGGIEGLFNIFEVDTDTMRYDAEQMQKDIDTYGLFTYEDFGGMIPEIAFEAFNGAYLKVSIGKGLLTWEDIAYLAERYIPLI